MAAIDDVVTYLEMRARPDAPPLHPPAGKLAAGKLALIRAEACPVSYYRYLYDTVGAPWLWFERREWDDARLAAELARPTTEVFVLYVAGAPAGYFELDAAPPRETELRYFGLMPEFTGRRLGPFLLQAAIDRAWARPLDRFWLHTCTFDHPKALPLYQRAGFVAYARRPVRFDDPRERGLLPRTLAHPRLPPLDG